MRHLVRRIYIEVYGRISLVSSSAGRNFRYNFIDLVRNVPSSKKCPVKDSSIYFGTISTQRIFKEQKAKKLHYAVGGIFGVDALLMSICLSYFISFAQHKGNEMYKKKKKNVYSSLLL